MPRPCLSAGLSSCKQLLSLPRRTATHRAGPKQTPLLPRTRELDKAPECSPHSAYNSAGHLLTRWGRDVRLSVKYGVRTGSCSYWPCSYHTQQSGRTAVAPLKNEARENGTKSRGNQEGTAPRTRGRGHASSLPFISKSKE